MKISQKLKKNRTKVFYLFILSVVFFIFLALSLADFEVKKLNESKSVKMVPLSYSPMQFPKLVNNFEPYISARGAIIMDSDSKVVLYEKNPNLRFSPASTTKIMSALVALEYFKSEDIITVKDSYTEGATLKLNKDEQFKFEDLLYAMLLPSANDAAKAIAANYPGGEEAFVARMNEKAKELGLNNTYYADPAGLMDSRDYTTPLELARLASFAMHNPEFAKIVSTKEKLIKNTFGKEYELNNLNILLDEPGVNGVKTGFTQEAGQVLVTSWVIPGTDKEILVVVMQSEDRFGDTQILLNTLNGNIIFQTIHQ